MAATHNRPSTPSRTLAQSPTCSSGGGGTPPRWTSRAPRTLAQSPTCSSGGGGTPPRSPSWAPRTLAQSPICSSGGGGTPPRRPSRVPRSSGSSSSAPGTASHRSSPTPASSSSTSSSSRPSPPRCSTGFEIFAFPCNQFGGQELGIDKEIVQIALTRFHAEYLISNKGSGGDDDGRREVRGLDGVGRTGAAH
ncbi:leucine-rich repeat extensin-like protein 5 [Triticum dicoccoides]|uniref:leucine-rich repeat extensin-like protein 5 n=1 Tax=Triticum dicoccoides TaxID=85692 RepID=UPI00188E5F88|nr:leucine-rich repeat extensin-like protein 5 [Triticum dicoccoides]XP_044323651.1 leucine-rich repeat extensin-like protein 5 isoform X1 [Triticum aestivum]